MEAIKDTIKSVIKSLEEKKSGNNDQIIKILEEEIGKKQTKHILLKPVKDGTLRIITDSSAQLFFLNLKKSSILKRLKTELEKGEKSQPEIQKIYFSLGKT